MPPLGTIYPRAFMEGVYLPPEDIGGWCVEVGANLFTESSPGPIHKVDMELDCNGCLTQGTVTLKNPRHPVFPAYSFTALFWVKSISRGWIPVGKGFIPPASQDGLEEYTLTLRPMEELSMKDYFDGSLAGATGQLNEVSDWMQKNEDVVNQAMKDRPKASIGIDWADRVVLAEPSQGQPVRIHASKFFEWRSTGEVTLPYGTRSRWDGGPGWLQGEYQGIQRPPFAERRAIDAGSVTFEEVTRDSGPPVVTIAELVVNPLATMPALDEHFYTVPGEAGQPATEAPASPGTETDTRPEGVAPPQRLLKSSVIAQQYAVVHVYDLKAWYEGSSLPGQSDNELVKQLQDAVTMAQEAFALSVATLGIDHEFTQQEQDQLNYSKNQLRLGRLGNPTLRSDYEPLTAKLSTGFVLDALFWNKECGSSQDSDCPTPGQAGYSLLTGTTIFLSTSPFDKQAVGLHFSDPDGIQDPEQFSDLVHPLASSSTIKVFDSHLVELDEYSRNTPFQQGSLEIPPDYFRGPLGPKLAQIMDAKWLESYDHEPPEGERPPSESWDGSWYFYVVCWWKVVGPEVERGSYPGYPVGDS